MSKVFTNDKGITNRYGSRMSSTMTKEKVECKSEERVWSGKCRDCVRSKLYVKSATGRN